MTIAQEQKDQAIESKWLRAVFEIEWPRFCRSCDASGVVIFYESHGMPGPAEQFIDPCEKCENHCPRCGWRFGEASSWEDFFEDQKPCPECRWNWGKNEGDTLPIYDGP